MGDAYILKHVIHDWADEHAGAILKNCRDVMRPDGRLVIVEGLYPPRIDRSNESRAATTDDVNMMVLTGGRHRSEPEFRSLYESGGVQADADHPDQGQGQRDRRSACLDPNHPRSQLNRPRRSIISSCRPVSEMHSKGLP